MVFDYFRKNRQLSTPNLRPATFEVILQGLAQGFLSAGLPPCVNIAVQLVAFETQRFYGVNLLACAALSGAGLQAGVARLKIWIMYGKDPIPKKSFFSGGSNSRKLAEFQQIATSFDVLHEISTNPVKVR